MKKTAGKQAAQAAATASLSLAVLLAAAIAAFFLGPKSVFLALAVLALSAAFFLLSLALRKFANDEVRAGSLVVKKANLFAGAGFALLMLAITERLDGAESIVFSAAALAVFAWLAWFGKKTMKYW